MLVSQHPSSGDMGVNDLGFVTVVVLGVEDWWNGSSDLVLAKAAKLVMIDWWFLYGFFEAHEKIMQ